MDDLKALELMIKMKEHGITDDDIASFKAKYNKPEPTIDEELVKRQLDALYANDLTDEEILYWATPYGLELEAKKKREKEARDESLQQRLV